MVSFCTIIPRPVGGFFCPNFAIRYDQKHWNSHISLAYLFLL